MFASSVVEERFVNTVCSPGYVPLARRSSLWLPVHHVAVVAAPAVRLSLVQSAPAAPSPPSSPLSSRACRCGRQLDCFGHHRASCSRAGVLGRRGFALESAVARVCREAGARVSANVFLRDLDLPIGAMDQRRIEVIVEGLPVFHGAQLAIDATLVSPLRADGEPHRRCPEADGAALAFARRRKERTYTELAGSRGRARLVVIVAETGGRFSEETQTLLRLLAEAKTRSTPQPLRVRARQSWLLRWSSLLSCAAARAFASSLLGLYGNLGADGDAPSVSDVIGDFDRAHFTV